jgi:hypothetical protein
MSKKFAGKIAVVTRRDQRKVPMVILSLRIAQANQTEATST